MPHKDSSQDPQKAEGGVGCAAMPPGAWQVRQCPAWWHPPVLDSEDQLVEAVHVLEAGLVCHRVDDKETISSPHVLLPHCTELLLACSIQN